MEEVQRGGRNDMAGNEGFLAVVLGPAQKPFSATHRKLLLDRKKSAQLAWSFGSQAVKSMSLCRMNK